MQENLLGQFWSVEILEFLARELAHETRRMVSCEVAGREVKRWRSPPIGRDRPANGSLLG